jgi:hypothetical protein
MKPQCILLYGNHTHPGSKYAGTFRIASELRKNGYEVQCIDTIPFNGFDDDFKKILRKTITEKTLWLGISTTFLPRIFNLPLIKNPEAYKKRWGEANIDSQLREFVQFVKSLNPDIKLISGGARHFPLDNYGFQMFKSYGDAQIVDYTKWCEEKLENPNPEFLTNNIQGSEYQDFATSQILYEHCDIIDKGDTLPIEISRGCIFKCKFCAFSLNGKKKGDWIKHANVLKEEFQRNYEMHGVTSYIFADDTYNDSVDKIKSLYDDVYSKLNFKIEFTTYLRLDLMVRFPESAAILRDSGLKSAMFGVETIHPLSAKAIGKGLDPQQQFAFIKQLKQNEFSDVMLHSGFIAGLPFDTKESLDELEQFIFSDKNYLDYCVFSPLGITPMSSGNLQANDYSEFDLEYEKHGYEIIYNTNGDLNSEINWINHNTGLTSEYCAQFANKMNTRVMQSGKFKFGAFLYGQYKSIGIPGDELRTLPTTEILKKYSIAQLTRTKLKMYKEKLLKFHNIS